MSEVTLFLRTRVDGSASGGNIPELDDDDASDEDAEGREERSAAAGMVRPSLTRT
jgi:hypothetical protein